ncbi:MAG: hypothetical protein NTW17_01620 [Candidatus Pacearchaeota archaeon]|nr:hypothetical protein [Candidatus Pacearchaeota archaeon]
MKKNKTGGEKIISVYWFAILFIVAGAVVYMAAAFYGKPYDVREIEAQILANHVANCLSDVGYLKENVIGNEDFQNNFLEECALNFNTEEKSSDPQYFLKVQIFQESSNVFEVSEGNANLVTSCGVESEIEHEKLAKCAEREFYSLGSENNLYLIKVLSIVRKTEQNVR